ncbi:hypothetical protein CCACVL1_11873 [Corchorus capsularis]|uniref:Uncharacterized protein n=1 Tax=Corchorus capsularis TaxID=210143 RepID=A0A1R3IJ34_COCAP|nr:hypothetical protein CCACVL1_11873 [Corchorus capsularis]
MVAAAAAAGVDNRPICLRFPREMILDWLPTVTEELLWRL